MPCLGRLLLKTDSIVIASLPKLFVSPSVFLPGACSAPLWPKPRSLVCTGWYVGYLGLLPCQHSPALSLSGDIASVLSSAVSVLLGENAAHQLIAVALGALPNGKCHQLACLAAVTDLLITVKGKTGTSSCFFFFLPSYIELIYGQKIHLLIISRTWR